MTQKNDQVFQLSLTELAFTITFILMLLLGYLVFKEQVDRKAAEDALSKVHQAQSIERVTAALDAAKSRISTALQRGGVQNPDELISKLIAAEDVRAERDRLKQLVEDLDAKLTALTELRTQVEKAAASNKSDVIREEVESALAFQEVARKALEQFPEPTGESKEQPSREALDQFRQEIAMSGELRRQLKSKLEMDVKPGQEAQAVCDVVDAAKNYGELAKSGKNPESVKKENADLRGQVAFLKKNLEARGGRDYPPCWADEKTGKVEFLFSIEVNPDAVVVVPAWLPSRDGDARALPGLTEVLTGSPHSNSNFVSRIQGIFNKSQELQCRHYVQLKSSISDAVQSDRARLMVENYFYKVEVRR